MDELLLARIKRLILAQKYLFSEKAEIELLRDHITRMDVIEAIINAPKITKKIKSRSKYKTSKIEYLYIIPGITWDGIPIYTKGTIKHFEGEDVFYLLISSKRYIGS
ncbi:MAG: hypothetical protein A2583_02145 [Bdellovibrionales bacterium RIFOXYD1_FULL_53_11]|nr:MAG: hypothetical protein A2583_02145 [Bdellovibrionales bacterium RIFOXYD1_FULL_53_11]